MRASIYIVSLNSNSQNTHRVLTERAPNCAPRKTSYFTPKISILWPIWQQMLFFSNICCYFAKSHFIYDSKKKGGVH